MPDRYQGNEPCTSPAQVVRYLTENYVDKDGDPMPRMVALDIVSAGAAQIERGISVFGSNVYYLGDEALGSSDSKANWTERPDDNDEEER